MRLAPRPRVVDAGLLVVTLTVAATGLASWLFARPADWPVIAVHGVGGVVLAVLLGWKLQRVLPWLRSGRWTGPQVVSVVVLVLAVAALATGVAWVHGGRFGVGPWTGLSVHVGLGVLVLPVLAWHLRSHWRLPSRADFEGRRTALKAGLLLASGALAWRLQQAVVDALGGAGAARRFTGSRPVTAAAGLGLPVTSWVADDPDPVDPATWRLQVGGRVERPFTLAVDDLDAMDEVRTVLDCTSGWYAERAWQGVRVGRLLDRAGVRPGGRWVRFRSVTGYRFSLPLAEARGALLATHVEGAALPHGHGAPARLVAPGRRGFQWVKWVVAVEVLDRPDAGQWVAIFTSGFTGRGRRGD